MDVVVPRNFLSRPYTIYFTCLVTKKIVYETVDVQDATLFAKFGNGERGAGGCGCNEPWAGRRCCLLARRSRVNAAEEPGAVFSTNLGSAPVCRCCLRRNCEGTAEELRRNCGGRPMCLSPAANHRRTEVVEGRRRYILDAARRSALHFQAAQRGTLARGPVVSTGCSVVG